MDGFGSAESAEAIMARLARRGMTGQANGAYTIQAVIGNGAYGTVYRALDRRNNNRVVALKEVKVQSTDEGVPLSTLREINTLKQLDAYEHPNIVKLFDVFPSGSESGQVLETRITLVFEFVDQDLSVFLERVGSRGLSELQIKDMCRQMLSGLDFLHTNRICHRDLKPQNILVSKASLLKLADFGLSRAYQGQVALTSVVVTLWYRSPEVLLQGQYATPVDVWSLGCIFAELYLRRALFCGQSEIDQLHKIFDIMGTPEPWEWPRNVLVPITSFSKKPRRALNDVIRGITPLGQKLLEDMLVFVPGERISAKEALEHAYFTGQPESEPEASDESHGETYTDEESDTSLHDRRGRLNASRVLDLGETSNELELSIDHLVSSSTRPEPNIIRGSAEKKRRSAEKKRESNESNPNSSVLDNVSVEDGISVLSRPILPRKLTETEAHDWLDNGRDFVDGSAKDLDVSNRSDEDWNHGDSTRESAELAPASDDGYDVQEIEITEEVVVADEAAKDHMTSSIDTLLAAAQQTATTERPATEPTADLDRPSHADELDAVDSLLNFSSGLPNCENGEEESIPGSLNASSTLDSSLEDGEGTDCVDGEIMAREAKLGEMADVLISDDSNGSIENEIAAIEQTTTSIQSTGADVAEIFDTPPKRAGSVILVDDDNSPEKDDNSNIVDRKRKYELGDLVAQPAKRRKL